MTKTSKGNKYKYKMKAWLVKEGYTCEYLEKYQHFFKAGRMINIKRDLFASDILAMKKDRMIFANSLFNEKKYTGNHLAEHIKEFAKYPFPDFVDRWLFVWRPKDSEPRLIDAKKYETTGRLEAPAGYEENEIEGDSEM